MTASLVTKTAQEFGRTVTLYRMVDTRGERYSTLWHSTEAKAREAWERKNG